MTISMDGNSTAPANRSRVGSHAHSGTEWISQERGYVGGLLGEQSQKNDAVVEREARVLLRRREGPGDDLPGHDEAGGHLVARDDIQAALALGLETRVEPQIVAREAHALAPLAQRSKQSHHALAADVVQGEVGPAAQ